MSSSPLLTIFPSPLPTLRTRLNSTLQTLITTTITKQQHFLLHHQTPFTPLFTKPHNSILSRIPRAQLGLGSFPLISPQDHWGTWSVLFSIGAFGIWSEKTKIGSRLSGAVVSTLIGLLASNIGIISYDAPVYSVVMEYLLQMAIPLLLFKADLRRVIKSTGKLLMTFLLGSVATIVGTMVAYQMVPMRQLGQDSWKIAAALMSSYIGGTVNFVAVSKALNVSPSVLAAGIAADNVICAIYFTFLFALASKIPPEVTQFTSNDCPVNKEPNFGSKLDVLRTTTALATSFAICKFASHLTKLMGVQWGSLPFITATVVILATIFPMQFGYLAPGGEAPALILMQVHSLAMK
ncbi:hypothetical protein GIB67_008315 [Kingdonia uniflora]|uniref:Uncharacterized protein n=1 Tax=Kingdonia uniflora TaxID=39325 RepID=A0A7J7N4X9_9MAGN|nr:hypothetical protein GIB67_008315 [Kingdonia uniflora]